MMNTTQYKAMVVKTIEPKVSKDSLRSLARKTQLANVATGITGFNVEVGQLMHTLNQYVLGFQMKPEWRKAAEPDLCHILYYSVMLARALKIHVPGGAKRTRLHGLTLTAALLGLQESSTHMLHYLRNALGGTELDVAGVTHTLEQCIELLWPLCTELTGHPPATLMQMHANELLKSYPDGYFNVVKKAPRGAKQGDDQAAETPKTDEVSIEQKPSEEVH